MEANKSRKVSHFFTFNRVMNRHESWPSDREWPQVTFGKLFHTEKKEYTALKQVLCVTKWSYVHFSITCHYKFIDMWIWILIWVWIQKSILPDPFDFKNSRLITWKMILHRLMHPEDREICLTDGKEIKYAGYRGTEKCRQLLDSSIGWLLRPCELGSTIYQRWTIFWCAAIRFFDDIN